MAATAATPAVAYHPTRWIDRSHTYHSRCSAERPRLTGTGHARSAALGAILALIVGRISACLAGKRLLTAWLTRSPGAGARGPGQQCLVGAAPGRSAARRRREAVQFGRRHGSSHGCGHGAIPTEGTRFGPSLRSAVAAQCAAAPGPRAPSCPAGPGTAPAAGAAGRSAIFCRFLTYRAPPAQRPAGSGGRPGGPRWPAPGRDRITMRRIGPGAGLGGVATGLERRPAPGCGARRHRDRAGVGRPGPATGSAVSTTSPAAALCPAAGSRRRAGPTGAGEELESGPVTTDRPEPLAWPARARLSGPGLPERGLALAGLASRDSPAEEARESH